MNIEQAKRILEAAILVAEEPQSAERLATLFADDEEKLTPKEIKRILEDVAKDYQGRGIELKETASGYRFQVNTEVTPWLMRLTNERPPRYSRALLETLALIAYKQPITRAEIEEIRSVAVNTQIIKNLQERGWIKTVGHRDLPGKPELLATTKEFLDYFNLKSLTELPDLISLSDVEQATNKLQAELAIADENIEQPSIETDIKLNIDNEAHEQMAEAESTFEALAEQISETETATTEVTETVDHTSNLPTEEITEVSEEEEEELVTA